MSGLNVLARTLMTWDFPDLFFFIINLSTGNIIIMIIVIRSTLRQSRPNKAGLKCPSVRLYVSPSTKSLFSFNEIGHLGRGR